MLRTSITVSTLLLCTSLYAADLAATPKPAEPAKPATPTPATPVPGPKPTLANVPYGTHPKQVVDFYKAESDKPTPVVLNIHGGGWMGGSKERVGVANFLKAGISVVAVEYRFIPEATADGVNPPVAGPLGDAARALQFVRSKAKEWNIDKTRIGATGGSAGACSSLWLAFHPDMADAKSSDPIARESTRLLCAAVVVAQTTLDPQQMKEWTPNSNYGAHAFGFTADQERKLSAFDVFLENREKILPWIAEYSPYALVTRDAPPIYLTYGTPPALGQEQKDPTHTANFGVKLQEHCKEVGVECELVYPGAPDVKHPSIDAFLIEKLSPKPISASPFPSLPENAMPGRYRWIEEGMEKGIITLREDHSFIAPSGAMNPKYRWEIARDAILIIFQNNLSRFNSIESPGVYVGANQNNQARRMEKIE